MAITFVMRTTVNEGDLIFGIFCIVITNEIK